MGNGLLTATIVKHKETFKKLAFYTEIQLSKLNENNDLCQREKVKDCVFLTGSQKLKDILNMCVISVKLVAPNFKFPEEM